MRLEGSLKTKVRKQLNVKKEYTKEGSIEVK